MKLAGCGTFAVENKCVLVVCKIWSLFLKKNTYYLATLEPNGDTNQTKQQAAVYQLSLH